MKSLRADVGARLSSPQLTSPMSASLGTPPTKMMFDGLHVAVDQPVLMQVLQGRGERQADLQALGHGQADTAGEFALESARLVSIQWLLCVRR